MRRPIVSASKHDESFVGVLRYVNGDILESAPTLVSTRCLDIASAPKQDDDFDFPDGCFEQKDALTSAIETLLLDVHDKYDQGSKKTRN